jgi:hypothetical protein
MFGWDAPGADPDRHGDAPAAEPVAGLPSGSEDDQLARRYAGPPSSRDPR